MTKTTALRASLLGASVHAALLLLPYQSAFAQAAQSAGESSTAVTPGGVNTTASSDDAAAGDDLATLAPVMVTGSASYDARRDDTASRIVITQEELQKFGDTELSESIKRLPGVTVGTGPAGKAGAITLRGMGNGYTQILLNGERAPDGFTLDSLSPDMIERIEIQRTATAELRAEAIAGIINIVLKKSTRSRTHDLKLNMGSVRGELGPSATWQLFDQRGDLSYVLNGTLGRRNFLVTESARYIARDAVGDLLSVRNGDIRVAGHSNTLSMSPSLNLRMDNGDTFSIQGFLDAEKLSKYGDIDYAMELGAPVRHMRYRQTTKTDSVQMRTDLNWTHTFENTDRLATKLSLNNNRQNGLFRELGYDAGETQNLNDTTSSRIRERGFSSTGKYSTDAFDKHSLELGWDGGIQKRSEHRVQRLADLPGIPGSFSDLDFDARINRIAFYAQDEWTVTSLWSLYLGARWERFETVSQGNSFSRIRTRDEVVSPLLQSLWKLPGTKNDQIRLGLSRTYNSPRIAQLIPRPYTSTNNSAVQPDQRGNPALKPELALGIDLAYEHYWADEAMLSLGAYGRRIDDVIRNETRFIDGRWVSSPNNGGQATAWGLEMDSKFPLKHLIAKAPEIDVRFNLTRNWSRVDDVPGPDNRIPEQIKLSSTLAADYKINADLTVGGSYTYKSGGYIRNTLFQAESSAPRREFDLYGLLAMTPRSKLRLSVGNLLHQDIVSGLEYFDDTGSTEIIRHRVSPLVYRATLEIKL